MVLPVLQRLSPRLQAVADQVIPRRTAVDVGADHAQLAVYLVATGHCPRVMAIECRPGPLAAAAATIRRFRATDVELRLGNGLRGLVPGAYASIVIAGMGGRTIRSILEDTPAVVRAAERLVLQPNTEWAELRGWLAGRGWPVTAEHLVEERRRTYLIMAVDPRAAAPWVPSPVERLLGFEMTRRDPVTDRWIEREIGWRRKALSRMEKNGSNGCERLRLRRQVAMLDDHLQSSRVLQRRALNALR